MPYIDAYWSVTVFILGAAVGSFLNVVILRVPKGHSIVHPPSQCPECGSAIRYYDNIPILGFLFLGGRCRDCGCRISVRYPLIELLNACVSLALYKKFGLSPAFMIFFVYCSAMIVVFWIDLDHMIIPDVITLNGIPVGIIVSLCGLVPDMNVMTSVGGTLFGFAILYIPAVVYEKLRGSEGLGGGDIKLLAMVGSFTGVYGVVFVLFSASLLGSAIALISIAVKGSSTKTPIPFGPFLTTAGVAYVFLGKQAIEQFYSMSYVF